jgi:hypothetical protein
MTGTTPQPTGPGRERDRTEVAFIAVMGLAAGLVYLRTLYPGLVATGDSPKFQYLGRILGTAHNPGYPLYIMLSHVFSWIPLGTLAYRMNLFSACWAVVTVVFVALACRRLGCGRVATLVACGGLAFGQVFWSQALLAEVYSLACALLAATLYMLVVWADTRRQAWLLGAMGLVALSLGHHLTIVTVAPALALFVLLHDRGVLSRRSLVLAAVGFLILGLAQYGFILVRTRQGAAYLGSQATNLAELWDVLRAKQFGRRLFAFDLRELVAARLTLVGRLLWDELGLGGAALGLAGTGALLRSRRYLAALLLGGALGPIVFALNYDVPDLQVFIMLSFVLIWPVVGLGAEYVTARVAGPGSWRGWVVGAALTGLPIWQLASNFKGSDHSDRTFESRYFSALFDWLPARSAVVTENHSVDHLLNYMLYGEGWAARKDIELIPPSARHVDACLGARMRVFAFEQGAARLEREHMTFAPVRLIDRGLAQTLDRLPPGYIVLAAANREGIAPFVQHLGQGRAALKDTPRAAVTSRGFAMLAVVGEAAAGPWMQQGTLARVEVAAGADGGKGKPKLPVAVRVIAGDEGILIEADGTVLEDAEGGAAVAVLRPNGKPLLTQVFAKPGDYRVGFPSRVLPLRELVHRSKCRGIANSGWVEVTDLGRLGWLDVTLDNRRPAEARLALLMVSEGRLRPRVFRVEAPRRATVEEEGFDLSVPRERDRMERRVKALGLGLLPPVAKNRVVTLLRVAVNDRGESARFRVAPGGQAVQLWAQAQVDRDEAWRALVCDLPLGGAPLLHGPAAGALTLSAGDALRNYLDDVWGKVVRDGALQYRRCPGPRCEVLLPLAEPQRIRARMTLRGSPGGLTLRVNGWTAGGTTLSEGWRTQEWEVPSERVQHGLNRLELSREPVSVSGTASFDLASVSLEPLERQGPPRR